MLCKLIYNVVCARTMGNFRNKSDVRLVGNETDYLKCTSKPSYISYKKYLIMIQLQYVKLKLHEHLTNQHILHLRKALMYEFRYDYIKDKSSSNSRLLFTDTDILMYGIITEDVYKIFAKDKDFR